MNLQMMTSLYVRTPRNNGDDAAAVVAILRVYFINIKLVRSKAMLTLYVIPCT